MSFPLGYDPSPLSPIVEIIGTDGDAVITFESAAVAAAPTQDYGLKSWGISNGVNTNHGLATAVFRDDDRAIDIDALDGLELKMRLGKDSGGLQTWFHGLIKKPKEIIPDSVRNHVQVSAVGWGTVTAKRIAHVRRFQKRESDGLTPDPNDGAARVSELYKSLLTDSDVLAFPGSGALDINTDDVDDIDIRIPDFVRYGQTIAMLLNELAETAGCYHGIDPDRHAYLRTRGSAESRFLVSTDLTERGILTRNWDQDRVMYVRSGAWTYHNSTVDSGYTTVHGLGAQHDILDHDDGTHNASLDLSSYHYAFPFTCGHDNLSRVSIRMFKTGSPSTRQDMVVQIIGADGDAPKPDDVRKTIIVPGRRLEVELESAGYYDIPTDKINTTPGERLFLRTVKYIDSANPVSASYQGGSGAIYRSSDGTGYSSVTGKARMRSYASKSVHLIGQNTVSRKNRRPQETVISMDGFPGEESAILGLEGMLESLGRRRRVYDPITVTAPTSRPPLGAALRILDPGKRDLRANLIGYTIMSSADDPQAAGGAITITVDLEEYF